MNQHRRDLNTNELDKLAQKAAPFFEKHGNTLLYGACAIVLALAIGYYFVRTSASADAAAWNAYFAARTPEEFGEVAEKFPDRSVADWARVQEAEMYLSQSVRGMFQDREGAVSDLKKARETFEAVLQKSSLPPTVQERAQYGLARTLETLCDGDTAPAVEAYERLLTNFPDSIHAQTCQERITLLKSDEAREFYAWFSKQDPKPEDIRRPQDTGLPPGHPSIDPGSLIRLPEIPDMLKLPEEPQSTAPSLPDDFGPAVPSDPAAPAEAPAAPATPEPGDESEKKDTAPALPENSPN